MKTKTVIVTWTELVEMSNTIEVPEDWTKEDIMCDPNGIMFDGAWDHGCDVDNIVIEFQEDEE
jgi:hypothetical protein